MSENDQVHFKNLAVLDASFLQSVLGHFGTLRIKGLGI